MNGNFLYAPLSPGESLLGYLRMLLENSELESAAEVLLQMAEESEEDARAGLHEVVRHGHLEPVLRCIGQGESWMRLARVSVLRSLRCLTDVRASSPSAPRWSEVPRAELLGPLCLTYRDFALRPENWPSAKAMRLLACLIAQQGRPLSCAEAIEMLWPELCPGRGRSSLRNCIYQVRYALRDILGLPGDGIVRHRIQDTLSLERPFQTDVEAFELAVEQARRAAPAEALSLATRADELYRAPFLHGLEDAWIEPERTRLAAIRGSLLQLLARCQLGLGDFQRAEQTARRGLQHDDLSEQAWTVLLEVQLGQGRESEARRLYREAVAHFEAELGCRPVALGDAYDRLLAPPAFLKVG